jgi:predicted molibdopterin-dependent oxidoreductase YjgC
MKLVDGKWQKMSWEQAINEVGDKIWRSEGVGPRRAVLVGSSKQNNEQSYLFRKFVSRLEHGSPGPHLPFDDGRQRSQHLGLRRC